MVYYNVRGYIGPIDDIIVTCFWWVYYPGGIMTAGLVVFR